jgi:hypothetical protein
MKLAVTFGRPFAYKSSKVTDGAEQVETTKSGSIKDFHKYFGGNGL